MGLWSRFRTWVRRRRMGYEPHPRIRCPKCKSRYVRGTYGNRFECSDCGNIFS